MFCRKCQLNGTIVIRKEYCYCNDCFLVYIDHKFRACIGKNKKIPWNDNVLVCLSGGKSSTALLDLVHSAISINSHKKLRINPVYLHLTGIEKSTDNEILNIVKGQCKKYNIEVNIVHINEYYSSNKILANLNHQNRLENLECSLNNLSTTTKYDFITIIKNTLFTRFAKELLCSAIFTGESTNTLAVKLLSNIALGRGSQISNDIGFADKRDFKVEILRPMKEITTEEIEHYIKIKDLLTYTDNSKDKSLQSVVENFVSDLQENFSATLSTVCKTADKISTKIVSIDDKTCMLCRSNFNNEPDKFTAIDATNISRVVSSEKFNDINKLFCKIHENDDNLDMLHSGRADLCYSCNKNFLELSNNKIFT